MATGDFKLNVVVDNNDAQQKPLAEMTSLPIQAVYQDRGMVTGMNITPNPAASVATVSYGLLKESEITIRLFDAFGQEVGRFGRAAAAGDQQAVIGTEGLANGFYRVMINAANGQVLASDNLIIAR
ncbi:MAG: T9SS C-terminal target domain-containing protein [Chlorobi bacterium CHB2]|nr:T9SS C-terminal target domain-containing protein [Chlorobi bacterium CHB2]